MEFAISPEDQKKLLNYARLTIHASLKGEKEIDPPHLSTSLKCGAFVTLKKMDRLGVVLVESRATLICLAL